MELRRRIYHPRHLPHLGSGGEWAEGQDSETRAIVMMGRGFVDHEDQLLGRLP